jgi:hypothetical protein
MDAKQMGRAFLRTLVRNHECPELLLLTTIVRWIGTEAGAAPEETWSRYVY